MKAIFLLTFTNAAQLEAAAGQVLGASPWLNIDQTRIDRFADATGDSQWIHVDPYKAASGPYGATIAHGYLSLSLIPHLARQIYAIAGATILVNYGLDRVRFPHPVRVGSNVRLTTELVSTESLPEALHVKFRHTVEIDGQSKPGCVADALSRIYF